MHSYAFVVPYPVLRKEDRFSFVLNLILIDFTLDKASPDNHILCLKAQHHHEIFLVKNKIGLLR